MALSDDATIGATPRVRIEELERGATFGRYIVLDRLGAGAMGVVYSAYDPELDRKVAIKVLRIAGGGESQGRARLVREAQALAKLSHPNVVTVHDAGTIDTQVYLAMEFVDGATLKTWLADDTRSYAETLEVFLSAGRGLAAAHDKGLVHRDFKPENVMIGADGRVRVMDFGLARPVDQSGPAQRALPTDPASAALSSDLTAAGDVMGTPRYMAPEQFAGLTVGPPADQFSFCVALYEALYGQRPFEGSTVHEIALAVSTGEARPPPRSSVPGHLWRVIGRGLSPAETDRFETMDALLVALQDDPRRRRRRLLLGAGAAGVFVVGTLTVHLRSQALERECLAAAEAIREDWNPGTADAIDAQLSATGLTIAPELGQKVRSGFDGFADRWAEHRAEACRLAARDPEPAIDDARLRCLDDARLVMNLLVEVLRNADRARAIAAPRKVENLPDLERCRDRYRLQELAALPEDPQTRQEVLAIRRELGKVTLGPSDDTARRERELLQRARATEHARTISQTARRLGVTVGMRGNVEEAEALLREAYYLAGEAGSDRSAALAALDQAYLLSQVLTRFAESHDWVRRARMMLRRSPSPDKVVLGQAALWSAVIYQREHNAEKMREEAKLAIDLLEASGDLNSRLLDARSIYASVLLQSGEVAAGVAMGEKAVAGYEELYGKNHPKLAWSLFNLGGMYATTRQPDKARASADRALELIATARGEDHPELARAHEAAASVAAQGSQWERAIMHYRRGIEMGATHFGPDSARVGELRFGLGRALEKTGDVAGALKEAEAAVRVARATDAPSEVARRLDAVRRLLRELDRDQDAAARDLEFVEATFAVGDEDKAVAAAREAVVAAREAGADAEAQTLSAWLEAHAPGPAPDPK